MDPIDTVYIQEEEIFNADSSPKQGAEKTSKTEETIGNLEQDIDKAYGVIESKFQELWKDNSGLFQEKQLEEHKQNLVKQLNTLKANVAENKNLQTVGESFRAFEEQLKQANLEQRLHIDELKKGATSALDALDSRLEVVENKASEYVGQFASFFSNIVSVRPETDTMQEKDVLYSSPLNKYSQYGTTRYDQDLLKLHTTRSYYIEDTLDDPDELKQFNSDAKTSEIDRLLKKYPETLVETMNELVPVEVSYNTFWYRYFKNENKLQSLDQQRKELLSKNKGRQTGDVEGTAEKEDEDDFAWDEDDEEPPVKVENPRKSQEGQKVSDKEVKTENNDDEEDDDDWE